MKISLGIALVSSMLLVGCAGTPQVKENKYLATSADVSNGNFATVRLCREESIVRSAEAPEIRVNKEVVGQLGSGGVIEMRVKPNTTLDLYLSANPLMYRFRDDLIFERSVVRGDNLALKVSPERNLVQGITVFLGGAVAEGARQTAAGQLGNWSVKELETSTFPRGCNN